MAFKGQGQVCLAQAWNHRSPLLDPVGTTSSKCMGRISPTCIGCCYSNICSGMKSSLPVVSNHCVTTEHKGYFASNSSWRHHGRVLSTGDRRTQPGPRETNTHICSRRKKNPNNLIWKYILCNHLKIHFPPLQYWYLCAVEWIKHKMQLFSDHFVCHMKEEKVTFRNAQNEVQGNFLL